MLALFFMYFVHVWLVTVTNKLVDPHVFGIQWQKYFIFFIETFLGTLVHFASVSYDDNVGKSSEFQCGFVLQKPCFFPLKFTFEFVSQRQILAMINWLFPRQWIKDHWV